MVTFVRSATSWFSASFLAVFSIALAAASARAESNLAQNATITVTVRPLTGGAAGVGSGQEGVGFGVALTAYQDDLSILLVSPPGYSFATAPPLLPPQILTAGDMIWLQPQGPQWLFQVIGMDPTDDHSVDLVGSLAQSPTSGGGAASVILPFDTAAADIQLDVKGGGQLLADRLSPTEGGGVVLTPTVSGAFPKTMPTASVPGLRIGLFLDPRLPAPLNGTLATVGTVTFTFQGGGANGIGIYQVGTGTAASIARLVTTGTGAGAGILVPACGFMTPADPLFLVANDQFVSADTLTATFTWDHKYRPSVATAATSQAQAGINESGTFVGAKSSTSTATNSYTAVDYLGINPLPTIIGPRDVPGLSQYTYSLRGVPNSDSATWTVTSGATIISSSQYTRSVAVSFSNSAEIVHVTATLPGNAVNVAPADVAVVQVTLGTLICALTFSGPKEWDDAGACLTVSAGTWVTAHDPGSDWAAFNFSGSYEDPEPFHCVGSAGTETVDPVHTWDAWTDIKLTAPKDKPEAIGKIEVGFIQLMYGVTYEASYGTANVNGAPRTLVRNGWVPNHEEAALDWINLDPSGEPDIDPDKLLWPWYGKEDQMAAPIAPSGTNSVTLTLHMADWPGTGWPTQWDPNNSDNPQNPNNRQPIVSGSIRQQFRMQIAARTTETANGAYRRYFQFGIADVFWDADYSRGSPVELVMRPDQNWDETTEPTTIDVNITPANILWISSEYGFLMWPPLTEAPGP